MSLNTGDVIRLKTHSPQMTVQKVNDSDRVNEGLPARHVKAQWFAGATLKSGIFPIDSVSKVGGDAE